MIRLSIILATILAGFMTATSAIARQPTDVNVVNTPTVNANIVSPNPVPVTGTVDAYIVSPNPVPVTGTVDANVNGTIEANIQGPIDVVDVDNPALQPVQFHQTIQFSSGHVQRAIIYQVPLGKRFVIEHISVYYAGTDGTIKMRAIIEVSNTTGCPSTPKMRHILQVPQLTQTSDTIYNYIVSQPIRLYADPGDHLCIHLNRSGDFNYSRDVGVHITGYHVDVP